MPETSSKSYVTSLDGLRALAVLFVLAYHLKLPHITGGLSGVTVFFVLSGYLITALLLAEFEKKGTIDLPHFWLRRVKRLFPAIVLVIFTSACVFTIFNHELLSKMRPDILSSLLFFNNWHQIFSNVSYFDALGSPSPLTTFWSLAIEEQFYLIWPPLLLILLKARVDKRFIAGFVGILAFISVVLMFVKFDPAADPSRVYYGTDTRAFSLLIGALLAFGWPCKGLGASEDANLTYDQRFILNIAGIVSLVALVLLLIFTNGFSPFLYRGGMFLITLLTAVVIANIVHPCSLLASFFSLPALSWVGTRSYGIYLWHYPILLFMIPRNIANDAPIWLILLFLVVTFGISELSYRFVENPIRKGGFLNFISKFDRPQFGACAAVFLVAIGGIIFVPQTSIVGTKEALQQLSEQSQSGKPAAQGENSEDDKPEPEYAPYSVLLIGDSVSLMSMDTFNAAFPGGHMDSSVSRWVAEAPGIIDYYKKLSLVGDVVVISLGTNGPVTDDQFDDIMNTLTTSTRVFFVNTRDGQDWQDSCNASIADGCQRWQNAHLVDWYSVSANYPDIFEPDGTHIRYDGAHVYTDLIKSTIEANGGLPQEPTAEEIQERNAKLSGGQETQEENHEEEDKEGSQ